MEYKRPTYVVVGHTALATFVRSSYGAEVGDVGVIQETGISSSLAGFPLSVDESS